MSKLKNLDASYAEKEPNVSNLSDYTMYHLKLEGVVPEMMTDSKVREQYENYLKREAGTR